MSLFPLTPPTYTHTHTHSPVLGILIQMQPSCGSRGYDHINTPTSSAWMAVRLNSHTSWSATSSLIMQQRKTVAPTTSPPSPHTMVMLPSTSPALSMSQSVSVLLCKSPAFRRLFCSFCFTLKLLYLYVMDVFNYCLQTVKSQMMATNANLP